jgi:hypothetical protein
MNVADIRTGIANALSSITTLRVYTSVPDSPQVPCAVIYPDTVQYGQAFSGEANVRMTIQVLTASVNTQAGQAELDGFCADSGSTSIPAKIEANPTLGGAAVSASVTEMRNYGVMGDTTRYYSAELVVDVYAT